MIDIDQLIDSASQLEPLPQTVTRLVAMLAKDNVTVVEIEDIFSMDGPLTARLLRQANSASSSSRATIGTVSAAVVRLGFGSVLALAVAASTQKRLASVAVPQYGMREGALWKHSQAARVAVDALRQHARIKMPLEGQTAALLHDIGKVVMSRHLNDNVMEVLQRATGTGVPLNIEIEREVLHVHHGELGGLIAQRWGLPDIIVRGIIYHHDPEQCTEADNRICHVVCLANWIGKKAEEKAGGDVCTKPLPASVEVLGVSPVQLETVVEVVAEVFPTLG